MGFIFGGSTNETQDSLDTKRKLALAMLARGSSTAPIQSAWQGAAQLSDALMGGLDLRQQDAAQKDADAQSMALVTGSPYTPPPQSSGFLSSLFGANKVPASDAQGQVAAASPPMGTPKVASAGISASPDASDLNAYLSDPSKRSTLPAGMRNNNPGNIKFVGQKIPGIVGPSQNTDEGDPQAVFDTPEDGMAAMHSLLLRKYDGGKVTADQIIAGNGGWTPGNHEAAANVARYAGISPGDNINLHDPVMATKFMRGLMMQEHGKSSGLYPDAMIASVVGGRPAVAPGQVASLDPSAGMGAPQQAAYVDPQVVTQQPNPAAQAIQQQAPLPGPGGQMPPQDPQQTASVGPMQPPQAAPPMAAPVNIPNQPISNPMPADLSGVGMGGAAPGPGQFPPAPSNPQAQLASAMQGGAPQQPQQANPQEQLAQAMQSAPVAPNPMRDNPRVQGLMRAMSNPNASPQMRAMVGAALQQEMSRGDDEYKLKLDAYQKQQDPQYQATLKKAQYEADHLGDGQWEKLDDGTLYNKVSGDTKAAQAPGQTGQKFRFSGGSIEGQALNGLMDTGQMTETQAQQVAAGKTITGPNGEIMWMSPQGLVSQPQNGAPQLVSPSQAPQEKSLDLFAGQPAAQQQAAPVAAPQTSLPNGATQLTGPKAPDKDEKDAAGFADRLATNSQIIDQTGDAGASRAQNWESAIPLVGNSLVSEDFQKFDNARRNFINAQLRRESGAAIGPSEFEEGNKQYFPQPGDGPEVIQQKAAARATAIKNMQRSAGPTYKPAEQSGPVKINGYTIEKVSP